MLPCGQGKMLSLRAPCGDILGWFVEMKGGDVV
jgi:hypothetical protein